MCFKQINTVHLSVSKTVDQIRAGQKSRVECHSITCSRYEYIKSSSRPTTSTVWYNCTCKICKQADSTLKDESKLDGGEIEMAESPEDHARAG